jgi:hypothetical protein
VEPGTIAMNFKQFAARAHEMFESIPEEYREGVDGLLVEAEAQPHPELADIYTLGECRTEQYPSDYGGPGSVRSFVVVFHGSFQRLSELDEGFDWEAELWETITHEVKHHLESLASEDALEVEDWVMDQNFARRQGEPFDPSFFRGGVPLEQGGFEVDGDLFVEHPLDTAEIAAGSVAVEWEGRTLELPLPEAPGETHFVTVEDLEDDAGEFVVVLVRRRGVWDALRSALAGGTVPVTTSSVRLDGEG